MPRRRPRSPPRDPWISKYDTSPNYMSSECKTLCLDYPPLEAQLNQQAKAARQLKSQAERIRRKADRLGFCTSCRTYISDMNLCREKHWRGGREKGEVELEIQMKLGEYVWWMEVGNRKEVVRNLTFVVTTEEGVTRPDYVRSLEEQVDCVERLQKEERERLDELDELLGRVGGI